MITFNYQVVAVKPGKNPGRQINISLQDTDEQLTKTTFDGKISEFNDSVLISEEKTALESILTKLIANHKL